MRSKKNMIKRLVSLLLCSAICVVAAAAADNWQYSKWTATVTGVSNIKYHGRTAITASKGLVRSTATILSTNTSALPAGYVKAKAELYRGPALASYGGPVSNSASSTGVTASTGQASGAGTYTAQGTTYYATSSNRDMETLELESVDYKTLVRARRKEFNQRTKRDSYEFCWRNLRGSNGCKVSESRCRSHFCRWKKWSRGLH